MPINNYSKLEPKPIDQEISVPPENLPRDYDDLDMLNPDEE